VSDTTETQAPEVVPPQYPPPPPIPIEDPVGFPPAFRHGSRHALLGPAFWVFGTLSWAYVVVGELVIGLGLPELLGALIVLATAGYAWVMASGLGDGEPFELKRLVPLILGLLLFVLLIAFTVSLLGSHDRSQISAVTILLWFASVFAMLLGRRWTPRESRPRSTGDRVRTAALWTLAVVGTLIAMVSAMGGM
jgi:hypothetical protein